MHPRNLPIRRSYLSYHLSLMVENYATKRSADFPIKSAVTRLFGRYASHWVDLSDFWRLTYFFVCISTCSQRSVLLQQNLKNNKWILHQFSYQNVVTSDNPNYLCTKGRKEMICKEEWNKFIESRKYDFIGWIYRNLAGRLHTVLLSIFNSPQLSSRSAPSSECPRHRFLRGTCRVGFFKYVCSAPISSIGRSTRTRIYVTWRLAGWP